MDHTKEMKTRLKSLCIFERVQTDEEEKRDKDSKIKPEGIATFSIMLVSFSETQPS